MADEERCEQCDYPIDDAAVCCDRATGTTDAVMICQDRTIARLTTALDQAEERAAALDACRREGRRLLRRLANYASNYRKSPTERLQRLLDRHTEQVDDYLARTHDPKDILR